MMVEEKSLLQTSLLELIQSASRVHQCVHQWSHVSIAPSPHDTVVRSVDLQYVETVGPDQRGIIRDAQADSKPHLPKG